MLFDKKSEFCKYADYNFMIMIIFMIIFYDYIFLEIEIFQIKFLLLIFKSFC